jgi:hypothetical protein
MSCAPGRARPGPTGVPVLTEAAAMIAAEQDLGRIAADSDVDTLAPALIGAGHLLFAGREGVPPVSSPGCREGCMT